MTSFFFLLLLPLCDKVADFYWVYSPVNDLACYRVRTPHPPHPPVTWPQEQGEQTMRQTPNLQMIAAHSTLATDWTGGTGCCTVCSEPARMALDRAPSRGLHKLSTQIYALLPSVHLVVFLFDFWRRKKIVRRRAEKLPHAC